MNKGLKAVALETAKRCAPQQGGFLGGSESKEVFNDKNGGNHLACH